MRSSSLLAALATLCWLTPAALQAQGETCTPEQEQRATANLACLAPEDLQQVISYRELLAIAKSPPDETSWRESLLAAQRTSACINNYRIFPQEQTAIQDFHCLQKELLDFYQQLRQPEVKRELQFQDLLAASSTRIHFCMLASSSALTRCLDLVEGALEDVKRVYSETAEKLASLDEEARARVMKEDEGIPSPLELQEFIELSLENARRFPRLLGKQFGEGLAPVLCSASRIYPKLSPRLVDLYNILIRFDFRNLAGGAALYDFMTYLRERFHPPEQDFSFLQLEPTDWSPSPPPCADQDWILEFPEFRLLPGFRLPEIGPFRLQLEELERRLLKAAELADRRNYIWKPFYRYGTLLLGLANSLRRASSRDPLLWETRHLLMEKARDALLMRGVSADKYPLDPATLHQAMTHQIDGYGQELLSNLQLDRLTDFGEGYLREGEALLTDDHKKHLHRLLALAYSIQGNEDRAEAHLQESDLQPGDLEEILQQLRKLGVGVTIRRTQ